MKPPSPNPCGSCPYRKDVPSGVWSKEEYLKLPPYDLETGSQPIGVFMCHQQDGRVCAGWCGTHDMDNSLAVRFAASSVSIETLTEILEYSTPTPLFASGAEACEHGLRDIKDPSGRAHSTMQTLTRKRLMRRNKL